MGKWGKCDIKELLKLQKRLEQEQQSVDAFLETCTKQLVARLLGKVIRRTPVGKAPKIDGVKSSKIVGASGKKQSFLTADAARYAKYWAGYTGGTLRRGWTGGATQDASSYANNLTVHKIGGGYKIEINNPVEYAPYVEFGHMQQPGRFVPALGKRLKKGWVKGQFMLTESEAELAQQSPKILENLLKKKLGDLFD